MRWLDMVSRDPVPWLLDPENPSSRYLTLRDIFEKHADTLNEDRRRIVHWEPIQLIISHWDPVHHWGRSHAPYYGGSAGTFGTLTMLQQLGAPPFQEAQAACEALLSTGKNEEGVFSPEEDAAAPWLCYTGIVLQIMTDFGYAKDPRVHAALDTMVDAILNKPENLVCPMVQDECRDGLVKALGALLHHPVRRQERDVKAAIEILSGKLTAHSYNFEDEDAEWMQPRYPRYYESDIVELCHVLAHTPYRHEASFTRLLQPLLTLQDADGRWSKLRTTPSLSVERIRQPSRWLTYEAIHTLTLVYGDDIYGPKRPGRAN